LGLLVTVLLDNPRSWFMPYARKLEEAICAMGHSAILIHDPDDIPQTGDIAFFLSCEKIIPKEIRDRSTHNLVIHSSDLPKGRGWSPMTWEVLNGASKIITCLFEASDEADTGPVYDRQSFSLEGHELLPELHEKQGETISAMVRRFIACYPLLRPDPQSGEPTFYRRRKPEDSELDPTKSIADQFDLLRVCDNDRYPAFFNHRGHRYVVRIEKSAEC